jgi:hypothetical protein
MNTKRKKPARIIQFAFRKHEDGYDQIYVLDSNGGLWWWEPRGPEYKESGWIEHAGLEYEAVKREKTPDSPRAPLR